MPFTLNKGGGGSSNRNERGYPLSDAGWQLKFSDVRSIENEELSMEVRGVPPPRVE